MKNRFIQFARKQKFVRPSPVRGNPGSRRRDMTIFFLKLGGILAGVAAVVLIGIFVVLPIIEGRSIIPEKEELTEAEYNDPKDSIKNTNIGDISSYQKEAVIQYNTENDAYIHGKEIVFSSAFYDKQKGATVFNKLVVFNVENEESEEIPVELKYENITQTKISENYIVYIDSNSAGGGRVMMYDRKTKKTDKIKDFVYAMPQIAMYDDKIAFMQQAGTSLDKLYVFDLATKEGTTFKIWDELPAPTTACYMGAQGLTYAVPVTENDVVSSAIYIQPFDGSDIKMLKPGRVAYSPKTTGDYTAFLSSAKGAPTDLYISKDMDMPNVIAQNVTNFDVGDGFIAYTKEGNLYVYMLETSETKQLNSLVSHALLSNIDGTTVCWYDVTGGFGDLDIIKYADIKEALAASKETKE